MPVWLQILLALGGSSLIGLVVADIYRGIKSKSKKHQEAVKKEKQDEMREVIQDELKPVKAELREVKDDLTVVKDGLQKDLYVDLTNIYNAHRKKQFASLEEKRDYDALYRSYHNLGQNGVADGMHDYVMHMNELKPKKPAPKKKKVLVENK